MSVPRPARRDIAIGVVFATVLAVELATSKDASGPFALDVALYGSGALTLCWRRIFPIAATLSAVTLAGLGSVAGTDVTDLVCSLFFLVLPGYSLGHEATGRWVFAALAALLGLVALITALTTDPSGGDFYFPSGIQLAAFTCGRLLRNRLELTRTLADEAARLELDRELRAQAAVGDERARIAREMHDVVAHTMAIMVVQAGAARSVLGRDPAAAEQALATVEETGRTALGELRRMLGFLREEAPAAELAPQPGLADIKGLLARAREGGLHVELREEGEPFELPSGAGLAAYRIVQEALTNTLKHAGPGTLVTVRMTWIPEALEIGVVDGGGRGIDPPTRGGGHGIAGMRERVGLYGGELSAEPRPDGGFAVRASIPRSATEVVA